jgi:H+/Cl- antiporter ClcA
MSTSTEAGPPARTGLAAVRLVVLAAAVGVPAALAAALLLALVHDLQHRLWTDVPDALGHDAPPWYLVVGLPVIGAALVVAVRLVLPGDGGHRPVEGLSSTPTPLAYVPGIALAALATLAFGAVLGPEAPVIALGSAVAIAGASLARLGEKERAVLSLAGSFAAISALFGGPLVGGILLMEGGLGLGAALLPMLLPGFVAAGVGYLVFIGFGDWGGLDAPGLVVPALPLFQGTHLLDLVIAVAVGLATALVLAPVSRSARWLDRVGEARLGMPALLLLGGLAVGVLALLADLLGAAPDEVLFSGQAALPSLLAEDSASIVLLVLVAKALAYLVSLSCGFRGGPVFPAVFIGVALAMLPVVWFDMSPTVALAIGAAAGTAAQTRLLLTSLVFSTLLVGTQNVDTVTATVLAGAAAWLTATALDRQRAPEAAA